MGRRSTVVWCLLLATLALCGPARAAQDPVSITTLSNRADLVSGDDVLAAIRFAPGVDPAGLEVTLGGHDVTAAFAPRDGRLEGLVEGLQPGVNELVARLPDQRGARLEIDNHPVGGPIFSGPQIQPWYCLPGAMDAQCNRPATFTWQYKDTTRGEFHPYDPANPPSDVATTTTDDGRTVPYVVRVEAGTMDRSQYLIAVLADPEGPITWNHKVYVTHGGGCGTGHNEAPAPVVMMDLPLSRGYAVMSTALENNQENCNLVVQAESVMMAKEHLIERYGDVRYLFGMGGSGGSMAQLHMANAYPGLYDGVIAGATFPDVPTNDLLDCPALLRYWENPARWAPGVVWNEPQQAAAAGLAATTVCQAWTKVPATWYSIAWEPHAGAACDVDVEEPEKLYDPATNPDGVRCSLQDYLINIFGRRPAAYWGPVEKQIGHGFAGRPYDNVGVQYGLRALMDGRISTAQFVDLNHKIGAVDIDFGTQATRVATDPATIAAAYRSGFQNETTHLDRVPIIDMPGLVPGDNYEVHDIYKSWALRQRLDVAHGGHGNHVIWYGPDENRNFQRQDGLRALETMDAWLAAVEKDERPLPLVEKVAANRPKDALDRCEFPDRATCDVVFGPAGNTRWGAGMPTLANDVIKCRLKPLRRNDYSPVHFTDGEWERLKEAFPTGVCDWDEPGVGQQETVAWQTYQEGPGGRPLGSAPLSDPLGGPSLGLPAATRRCASRRHFRIRVRAPRGQRLRSAVVYVNGRRVAVRRGKRLRAAVDLRGLPAGRVRVRIVGRTTTGRRVTSVRSYRTCSRRPS